MLPFRIIFFLPSLVDALNIFSDYLIDGLDGILHVQPVKKPSNLFRTLAVKTHIRASISVQQFLPGDIWLRVHDVRPALKAGILLGGGKGQRA